MLDPVDQRESFDRAWASVGASPSDAANVRTELVRRYEDPDRRYHGLRHVDHCLSELDVVRHHAAHPGELELAIWFHDAVYDPRSSANEADSANLAQKMLRAANANEDAVIRICDLIESTKKHDAALRGDAAILSDVDLAILGASPSVFARYEDDVRSEYSFVPDVAFWPLRRRFTRKLLSRERIFHTPELHEKYEEQARQNLQASPNVWQRLFPTFGGISSRTTSRSKPPARSR